MQLQQKAQTQSIKAVFCTCKGKGTCYEHMVLEDLYKLLLQRGKVRPPPVRLPQARPLPLPQKPQRGWCSPPRTCMLCVPSSMSPTGYTTCWVLPGCWCWTFSTPWIRSSSRLAPPHRYMHVSQAYIRCKPVSRYGRTRVGKVNSRTVCCFDHNANNLTQMYEESCSSPTICLLCCQVIVEEEEFCLCVCAMLCTLWLKQNSVMIQHNFPHSTSSTEARLLEFNTALDWMVSHAHVSVL